MDDDVGDDVEKMSSVMDVSCIDWMIRWIGYMSIELHVSTYSVSSLYS
jgi:hypothetical protein